MTTATETPSLSLLAEPARLLIDSRLDTIDRLLIGQVPRADRQAIVREVEAQIHDLLAERDPDDTDRDAVIAALGRLDPPEAYLPDEAGPAARAAARAYPTPPAPARPAPAARPNFVGKSAGILGLVAIGLAFLGTSLMILAYALIQDEITFFAAAAVMLVAGITALQAIIFAACARLNGLWPVIGLTTGIITILLSVFEVGFVVYTLFN